MVAVVIIIKNCMITVMIIIIKSQGQSKSKPQWVITSHLSECLSSKRPQIIHAGKDVEKREPLYTAGGNVNWCSNCGKEYGVFSKN